MYAPSLVLVLAIRSSSFSAFALPPLPVVVLPSSQFWCWGSELYFIVFIVTLTIATQCDRCHGNCGHGGLMVGLWVRQVMECSTT